MRGGFSLIEMLVALGVLSIAGLALMNTTRESLRTGQILEDRSLSALAAENILNAELARVSGGAVLATSGDYALGGREWDWRITVTATEDADLVRLDLLLSEPETGRTAAELTTFRRRS